ncbi:acyl-CoA dehydrogenase [Actinosynnema pretiosum subsp. pretiosum]|uniref:Acyl-CoA dehydrogenase domain protein n=2 Tax=Actinosynnema TaxID=40566 RepID=C6WCP5_ACTMD|nr:acyl-CoA dehydrogenase [Actinosynnema mirum]ACU35662.1 acyl-CoA dehydrogenase domain protein [Actinosynnema mirum DSM 43827]AXX29089.1 Isovaleryl-CoA dehydrogenase [Actinosynnema pretiosum subsp. pretiosum]QUF06635.1 acyl-CoA dehydrogenase [Actinosynnema pretiosum subsp. pretiosum]
MTAFTESAERADLRAAVAAFASRYGERYFLDKARSGGKTHELWAEAGKLGYLGVAVPEEHGGGGGGIGDLAAVCEELAAAGCPMLLLVVSPAICATVITRFGTEAQKARWLPGFADGATKMAFAITEPEAGSNAHRLTTTIRRDGDDWLLTGSKHYISAVDEADAVLVVARHVDASGQRLAPSLVVVPTDAPGFTRHEIGMELVSPEKQFTCFFDEVRLPADALVGDPSAGLDQLFAGLNPERIMAASYATGVARRAIAKAADYARTRTVWDVPIGAHQGLAHPLAQVAVQVELARLMTQKAAALYDAGRDREAGESANMAKYAAGEAVAAAVDQAIQVHGGNGLSTEHGLGALLTASRLSRIAPVSREMILNFVAQHTLRLPRSY